MFSNEVQTNVGVHATHCCPSHGCKYGDAKCPVALHRTLPRYGRNNGCEQCEFDAGEGHGAPSFSLRGGTVANV